MLIYNIFFPHVKEHFPPHTKASQLRPAHRGDSEGGIIFINSCLKKKHQTGIWGTHKACWWRLCLFGETQSKNSVAVLVALNSA